MTKTSLEEQEDIDPGLARAKWEFERGCRLRELELKEREQTNKDAELKLRQQEQNSATWRSPLIVAIFAAAVAGGGNAVVAFVNGSLQRDLESSKRDAELKLEKSKAESTRILELIKTGFGDQATSNDRAAANLDFLVKSGLVTDGDVKTGLRAYLDSRLPGAGVSLPAPSNARVAFEETSTIDRSKRDASQNRLNEYTKFLDSVGFPPSKQQVIIHVEVEQTFNAYYQDNKIFIDKRLVDDPTVALREYTHHILSTGKDLTWEGHFGAVESALADYFACSFLNTSKLGELAAKVLQTGRPHLRNLENQKKYRDLLKAMKDGTIHDGGEVWGGLFWSLRQQMGTSAANKLLAKAWTNLPMNERKFNAQSFISRLLDESNALEDSQYQLVVQTLKDRGFPTEAAISRR